jgi:predicted MFS family arabinose efflux permease
MKPSTENWSGRIPLMIAHCAGMVDLVALPVWVGTLISEYKFDPRHAGALATLFLLGAVASSLYFATRFDRIRARFAATAGFAIASLSFLSAAFTNEFSTLAVLHVVAGAAAGCALSMTHGTIGRAVNPHRVFAIVGMALGVFAIVFLGSTPNLVAAFGGPTLFKVFGGVMAIAAVASAIAFPSAPVREAEHLMKDVNHLSSAVWFGVGGVSCMALTQAMMFSFVQRIGIDRGFGVDAVTGVLVALGFVNLFPAPLAAVLEKRLSANTVLLAGPIVQAGLALAIATSGSFLGYAAPTAFFAAVLIFTHTFAGGDAGHADGRRRDRTDPRRHIGPIRRLWRSRDRGARHSDFCRRTFLASPCAARPARRRNEARLSIL